MTPRPDGTAAAASGRVYLSCAAAPAHDSARPVSPATASDRAKLAIWVAFDTFA
jgi:hypothetical protein